MSRSSTGFALVQMCRHEGMVAVHAIADGDDLSPVLEFFGLSFADWIENRWRLGVVPNKAVRSELRFCNLHAEPAEVSEIDA